MFKNINLFSSNNSKNHQSSMGGHNTSHGDCAKPKNINGDDKPWMHTNRYGPTFWPFTNVYNRSPENTVTPDGSHRCRCGELVNCSRAKETIYVVMMDGMPVKMTEEEYNKNCLPQHNAPSPTDSTVSMPSDIDDDDDEYDDAVAAQDQANNVYRQMLFRDKPKSQQEKILAQYTTEYFTRSLDKSSNAVAGAANSDDNNGCTICIENLREESSYQSPEDSSRDILGCSALTLCGHMFHTSCLHKMLTNKSDSLECPNCHKIHGVKTGTQPIGGKMKHDNLDRWLPGHRNSNTIRITYSFPDGHQGPEHPNPGRPYQLLGFPRIAFLPNNEKGNKVLKLLRVAFKRRLVFTVGTSSTNGLPDCVTWNDIHHKTSMDNYLGHGYPDDNYLDNVLAELANVGVTDEALVQTAR